MYISINIMSKLLCFVKFKNTVEMLLILAFIYYNMYYIINHCPALITNSFSSVFKCLYCSFEALRGKPHHRKFVLKRHIKETHFRTYDFKCPKCGISFYRKALLIAHLECSGDCNTFLTDKI